MILLHGNYQLKSRERLNELISQAKLEKKEIIRLNGLKIDATDLVQALASASFFQEKRLVIIENLFSQPKSKRKEQLLKSLKKSPDQAVVIWEKKAVDGRSLRSYTFIKPQLFKTPVMVFKFLDSFRPNNSQLVLEALNQAGQKDPAELIFYLLSGRIRQLIIAKTSPKDLQGAPWQRGKLHKQAEAFSLEQLKDIYKKLLEIDIKIKTGQAVLDLRGQLDLLVLNL